MENAVKIGRPRSEQARTAVLHAVDDLLLELGYAAMTMKGIAERAGVGRQTVYRWWSTKAEILFEASVIDAEEELAIEPTGDLAVDADAFLQRLVEFLTRSPAGAAYRALVGEAQQDPAVAELLAGRDIVSGRARALLAEHGLTDDELDEATAALAGPTVFWALTGHDPATLDTARLAERLTARYRVRGRTRQTTADSASTPRTRARRAPTPRTRSAR